ncbi:MAG TPA: ribosome biogenesis GTPase Der [Candidatus Acidoferrales bacterium]|nr:ribosome biogenesis GTPase Der [Candidatus Acidoferrales bacterium]
MNENLPSVVIAGRPNVGKSTLFNRLTGTRRSIVTNEPGITRDRIYGTANWLGRSFEVVDTGGIVPEDRAAIPAEILRQAKVAIESAALLVLVVDARDGLTPLDEELARVLRRAGKPMILAANKVDSQRQESLTGPLHSLGLPVFPLSAEHGYGMDNMLDYIVERASLPSGGAAAPEIIPPQSEVAESAEGQVSANGARIPAPRKLETPIQVAIIGRPNVGKSALLNQLAGEERSIVSPIAGTTRDSVDTLVQHGEKIYRFVDTAGIRRKGKTTELSEKLSVIMARKSLERTDVALLIVDASQGVASGDATIADYAGQSGCSVIIVMNKFDLALESARKALEAEETKGNPDRVSRRAKAAESKTAKGYRPTSGKRTEEQSRSRSLRTLADPKSLMKEYETLVRGKLKFLAYAPIVFVSALTGENVGKLYPLIEHVAAARRKRISTGEINRWLKSVDLERGTSPATRKVKIYYMTQASSAPPTFVLFTNQPARLHFSYERFLENRLRESFDFIGAPIRFLQRVKERGHRERGHASVKKRRRGPS